jgi:hypothetical protein
MPLHIGLTGKNIHLQGFVRREGSIHHPTEQQGDDESSRDHLDKHP